jgi:flagellar hook-length control protein FliK
MPVENEIHMKEASGLEPESFDDESMSTAPAPQSAGKTSGIKSSRQVQVMQEFMDSMESEFGIPPTRIVEAMTDLEPEELIEPAEDSASQFIKKLDLPPEDASRAQAQYVAMLHKLQQLDQTPTAGKMALPEALANGHLQQKMMVQSMLLSKVKMEGVAADNGQKLQWIELTEAEKADVKARLAQMADQLLKGPDALSDIYSDPIGAEVAMTSPAMMIGKDWMVEDLSPELQPVALKPSALSVVNGYQGIADSAATHAPATLGLEAQADSVATAVGAKTLTASHLQAMTAPTVVGPEGAVKSLPSAQTSAMSTESSLMSVAGGKNLGSASADTSEKGGSDNGAQGDAMAKTLGAGPQPLPKEGQGPAFAGAMAAAGAAHSSAPKENVQQLINQAQYVIKKGGGDAVVKMNSEALGDVHMKISVAEGKVNVQMSTQTKEAKDLLEASMKELKNSIGAHNLKVDHIKVDVGNKSADSGNSQHKDTSSFQAREDFNRGQNRPNSQDSFGKALNEGQSGQRQKTKAEEKVELDATRRLARSAGGPGLGRYVGPGRGTGLNLVA